MPVSGWRLMGYEVGQPDYPSRALDPGFSENIARLESQADTFGGVGARQQAELTELADWVEGLRAAAHKARDEGNLQLAEALDITRFEVYEAYLDKELHREPSSR
jgi:hypothetical protein